MIRPADPGLGFLNIPAIWSGVSTVLNAVGGSSGEYTDAQRQQWVDIMFRAAMNGDAGALDVLRCWAGSSGPVGPLHASTVQRLLGVASSGSTCGGMKTAAAKAYAGIKYNEARARLAGGEILRDAAGTAVWGSNVLDPAYATNAVKSAVPWIIGGIAAVIFLPKLLRGR